MGDPIKLAAQVDQPAVFNVQLDEMKRFHYVFTTYAKEMKYHDTTSQIYHDMYKTHKRKFILFHNTWNTTIKYDNNDKIDKRNQKVIDHHVDDAKRTWPCEISLTCDDEKISPG